MTELEPLAPDEARELYLDARADECSENTLEGHDYRLRAFVDWCQQQPIDNLNDLTGRHLYEYRVWRRDGGYTGHELQNVTLRGDMATLRAFLRFCGEIGAVPTELFDQVPLPQVGAGGDVSTTTLDPDRCQAILEYLEQYQWASREHVTLQTLFHTGCRTGGLRALDVDDLDLDGTGTHGDGPAIQFNHRPDTGTPLKNNEDSERWNSINQHTAAVIHDYIDTPRIDTTDDHGRTPLVTTRFGRISRSAIRDTLYRVTRPCWRGAGCPHGNDPDTCQYTDQAHYSKCPSARAPHDVRSGRVTAHRLDNDPREVVSDRLDASDDILDKHYDRRSERKKAEQRRTHLEGL